MDGAIEELITSYNELNAGPITELNVQPSALDFMRYVAKNRPFIVRGACSAWPAVKNWDALYLRNVMGQTLVKVAITPKGNADAVVRNPLNDSTYFVKPLEVHEPFSRFLKYVQKQEKEGDFTTEVKYAQTQNDNLREEYIKLFQDVAQEIPWVRMALGRAPEAINLWIGNSRSVTALHKDNYENIYCQVVGRKHFLLLSPMETACINEVGLQPATYVRKRYDVDEKATIKTEHQENLIFEPDNCQEVIPCATWDPDKPEGFATKFSSLSQPMRFTLEPGDMLYLPALWYHKVSQTCGEDGICCAINYWYDMDFEGLLYPASAFIRNVALTATEAHT